VSQPCSSGLSEATNGPERRIQRGWCVAAGLIVTALLQSSTATAMTAPSLTADGTVALVPALAVMLGANVGTGRWLPTLPPHLWRLAPRFPVLPHHSRKRSHRNVIAYERRVEACCMVRAAWLL